MVLGCVPVAGDGNCLFHALGYLDARDGAALRNEVAAFMVDQACSQEGFEDAWLEEAEELRNLGGPHRHYGLLSHEAHACGDSHGPAQWYSRGDRCKP